MSQVTSASPLSVNFGFAKKVRIKMVLPLATVLASVKRGTVLGDVSHFACQSESDVTTSQPPNPATAFLASVFGTKFPCSSRQKRSSAKATTAIMKNRNTKRECFIRSNETELSQAGCRGQ